MTDELEKPKEKKQARKLASKRDRSKFKKTDARKRVRAEKEIQSRRLKGKELKQGRVLAITPEGISVAIEEETLLCTLSGLLKKEIKRIKNLVTIGDFVLFDPQKLSIEHVEERHSVLARKAHFKRQQQLIAANIDQVLITVSVVSPPLKPALIDRYIIATLKGGMEPVVLINKVDLLEGECKARLTLEACCLTYEKLGIPTLLLSAETGEGMESLKKQMAGKASVFSGQSGVGKSTLINAMTGLNLRTGEVVEKTRKGSHTTSTAHLIPLPFGGFCIDTPGIRSFGLWNLEREDLLLYFPEITHRAKQCRYPDCSHTHEPACAVLPAVEKGKITQYRYDSYCKLLTEL